MAETEFDLIVLGGGPGGYVAAIRAAQLGGKVALIEREHLGGICLNWGCIPTKALLRTAEIYHYLQNPGDFGLIVKEVGIDLTKVVQRSRKIAARLNGGVKHLLKKNKVTVFDGHGRLDGLKGALRKLQVAKDGKAVAELTAEHVILATGARARQLPGLEADGKLVWTYKEAMVPAALPKSLLVIGSGAIGIEFASFYRTLGAEVTVVEVLPRVLPVEDPEISAFAHKAFEKQGMTLLTGTTVKSLKRAKDQVTATIETDGKTRELTVERVISAVGIVGNVEDIGLEGTQIQVQKTHVATDEWMATGEPGVFAIGDLTGPPWLAHKASHEGVICVEKLAGVAGVHPLDVRRIPGCTYCHPQVASVGYTEQALKACGLKKGTDYEVGSFPFSALGKAIASRHTAGMTKIIRGLPRGEILGAHIMGDQATELIAEMTLARRLEATSEELIITMHAHPTMHESVHEAAMATEGRAIHM